jgi:rhodanese-related sulfurtransferase
MIDYVRVGHMPASDGSPGVPDVVSGPEALSAAESGAAVFIDIRRPDEWMATGMPAASIGITLERPDFLEQVAAAAGDPSARVLLICRSGARSARALDMVRAAGFTQASHVGEGMIGSAHGPGWLARELPLRRPE